MTGRKASLLWKATVDDEKESGWRGLGGMAFSFFFCVFLWHLCLCIFFEEGA